MGRRQEGSAMILVLCAFTFITALCLMLLLGTSVSIRTAARANAKEQCRISAVSVSHVLIREIKSYTYGETLSADVNGFNPGRSLQDKLQAVNMDAGYFENVEMEGMEPWTADGRAEFSYTLEDEAILPGKTTVRFYWTEGGEEIFLEDSLEDADAWFGSILLYMEVTSTVAGEKSRVISCFQPLLDTSQGELALMPEEDEQREQLSWTWFYRGHKWERGEN